MAGPDSASSSPGISSRSFRGERRLARSGTGRCGGRSMRRRLAGPAYLAEAFASPVPWCIPRRRLRRPSRCRRRDPADRIAKRCGPVSPESGGNLPRFRGPFPAWIAVKDVLAFGVFWAGLVSDRTHWRGQNVRIGKRTLLEFAIVFRTDASGIVASGPRQVDRRTARGGGARRRRRKRGRHSRPSRGDPPAPGGAGAVARRFSRQEARPEPQDAAQARPKARFPAREPMST